MMLTAEIDTKRLNHHYRFYIVLSFISPQLFVYVVIIVKEVYFPFLDSKQKVEATLEIPLLGSIISKRMK